MSTAEIWIMNSDGTSKTRLTNNNVADFNPTFSPAAPPFDFSLSNSGGITVTQGGSGSNTITATLVSGSTQTVSLSASGLPAGSTASFNLASGNPTFSSTCTISTSTSTPTGSCTITVTGTGGSLTRTTAFTLAVNAPCGIGSTRIVLDASPKPGYSYQSVTIFGTLLGSWRCIRDGMVIYKPVVIATDWGFTATVTTDYYGQFSAATTCPYPAGGGTREYHITATFYEDQDLTGSSTTVLYQVIGKIPTTITISYVANRVFQGYLRRADTSAYLAYMPVKLTVHYLSGSTWQTGTFDLQTRHDGLWELEFLFYWNSATISFEGDETYASSSATVTR